MSNSDIFFTIIIPTYNRKNIIAKCINSVLTQTYQNFEILIIDNGSDDKTKEYLIKNFKDDRLKYIYQKGSGTPASPRNNGIRNAKFDWISFLDSDDFWDKDKLLLTSYHIKNNNKVDVLCHNERIFYSNKNEFGKTIKYGPFEHNFYLKMLLYGNRLSTSAITIKKSFLQEHNLYFNESKKLITVEDFDLWLRLARCNADFKFINKTLGYYVVNNENLIGNKEIYVQSLSNLLNIHKSFLKETNLENKKYFNLIDLRYEFVKLKYSKKTNFLYIINFSKLLLNNPYLSSIILIKQILK